MPEPKPDPLIARAFAALPDAITSAAFFCAWIAPAAIGYPRVRDLMLLMLIEFVVMHSGGFTAAIFNMQDISRTRRALFLTGLTAFYTVFVLGFSLAFDSTWPLWGFLWLFVSRFLQLFTLGGQTDAKMQRMMTGWVTSALAYLCGALFTAFIPLPSFGLTPQVVYALHLSGSGLWIEQPWTVIAFGAFYFAVLAWSKVKPFVVVLAEVPSRKAQP